jgi:hypothetical protein
VSKDVALILDGWDYRPDRPAVRQIVGEDGQTKIQLRLDLGLLQMEATGRPDGNHPHGHPTLFDHYKSLIQARTGSSDGDTELQLNEEDCTKLQLESMQFYHRRISWLELGEYEFAERDAEHNLGIINMVGAHAQNDQLREMFTQWKPFILVHRTMARARQAWENGDYDRAIEMIDEGVAEISDAYREQGREDAIESSGEVSYLRKWAEEIDQTRPLTLEQRLERELETAIAEEEFERAASLRDRLRVLKEEGVDPEAV